MIQIKFSILPFIKLLANQKTLPDSEKVGQVVVRVRWNSSKSIVDIFTSVYANVAKWDIDLKRAKRGTTHEYKGLKFYWSEINQEISEYHEAIVAAFEECSIKNTVPTTSELKTMVKTSLGLLEHVEQEKTPKTGTATMKEMVDLFLEVRGREKNWDFQDKEKYTQAFQHITKANPGIKPNNITVEHMYRLKDWYVKNEYRNRTINKQITMLKGFLKWLNLQDGYQVPPQVLQFATNLKVLRKTVTFLHYDELLHFAHFDFGENERLARARDFWCFMAFTSLRVSDLCDLKTSHIHDGFIEKKAIKTGERLMIPLVEEAEAILHKYKGREFANNKVFDIPSPQKLNDAVKEAAKVAGLDREIVDTYYIGTERREETHKFYEIICNHDGRRTFVSCSLAMGITPEVVMKSTGHQSYDTMKPYIDTATETQALEMEKWNKNQYRSQIINALEGVNETTLKHILEYVRKAVG